MARDGPRLALVPADAGRGREGHRGHRRLRARTHRLSDGLGGADEGVSAMRASGSGEPPPDLSQVTGREPFAMLATVLLFLLAVAAWAHVLVSPMRAGDMAGTEMAMTPSVTDAGGYVAAWAGMLAGVVLPGALPLVGLYAPTQRDAGGTPVEAIAGGRFARM